MCTNNECGQDNYASVCIKKYTINPIIRDYECRCEPGLEGENCEIDIDECRVNQCQHGKCVDGLNSYSCICTKGYTGIYCRDEVNECASFPCENTAFCVDELNGYTCLCSEQFTGTHCELKLLPCDANPCGQNMCFNEYLSFSCVCDSSVYTGPSCDQLLDLCASQPCAVGSRCINQLGVSTNGQTITAGSYFCECPGHLSGINCDNRLNFCDSNPCQNSDLCYMKTESGQASFKCLCKPGYTGKLCTLQIAAACNSMPCESGVCHSPPGSLDVYFCECDLGREGLNCDIEVDYCRSTNCLSGGNCVNNPINGAICTCPEGFTGTLCEIDINECEEQNPCFNHPEVRCVDLVNSFQCICPFYLEGESCDDVIDLCASNPCGEEGECTHDSGVWTCNCNKWFEGINCSIRIDHCSTSDCVLSNTAICVNLQPSSNRKRKSTEIQPIKNQRELRQANDLCYECICLAGYEGDYCEININGPGWLRFRYISRNIEIFREISRVSR